MTIRADFRDKVRALGLCNFTDFMSKPVGKLFNREEGGRELRLLETENQGEKQRFFLKRLGREPFIKLLQMLLFGRWPRSGPIRELQMLNRLNEAGFATMRPVAFGERRFFGWPVGGFLLAEEVRGMEVADFHKRCSPSERRNLFHSLGEYLGRLHSAGFFQPVRLKDLFLSHAPGLKDQEFVFTLIDRETSKPWPTKFSRRRALQALARATRRTLRDGHAIGRGEARAFCRGYHEALAPLLGLSPETLQKELFSTLRREFERNAGAGPEMSPADAPIGRNADQGSCRRLFLLFAFITLANQQTILDFCML
jgi:hypothetical protein